MIKNPRKNTMLPLILPKKILVMLIKPFFEKNPIVLFKPTRRIKPTMNANCI